MGVGGLWLALLMLTGVVSVTAPRSAPVIPLLLLMAVVAGVFAALMGWAFTRTGASAGRSTRDEAPAPVGRGAGPG
jgi:uncharacterized protein (DUF58 family)